MMFIQTYHTDGIVPTFPSLQKTKRREKERSDPVLPSPVSFLLSNLYLTLQSLALLSFHPAQPEPEHWYQAADALPHPKHTLLENTRPLHTLGGGGQGWKGEGRRRAHLLLQLQWIYTCSWKQLDRMCYATTVCQTLQVSGEAGPLQRGNILNA